MNSKIALLLVDLQRDFLDTLLGDAEEFISRVAALLEGCRQASIPIAHIWTSIDRQIDNRMPHWKKNDKWICLAGTPGHRPPPCIQPREGEQIVDKTFFSAFANTRLDALLCSWQCEHVLLAGIHLHSCVRATAVDAYQHGYRVSLVTDATTGYDPIHGEITRCYLDNRIAGLVDIAEVLGELGIDEKVPDREAVPSLSGAVAEELPCFVHCSPANDEPLWRVSLCRERQAAEAAATARKSWQQWRDIDVSTRTTVLGKFAQLLAQNSESIAQLITRDIGKPIAQSRAEVLRTIALIDAQLERLDDHREIHCSPNSIMRYCPLGVIAIITPWNNPIAIPFGKIVPALFYGNTVVWKPAPVASAIAHAVIELWQKVAVAGTVNLLCGDKTTAISLLMDKNVDAVTVSGSMSVGYTAQAICARRNIPLQAELGGNNAAIVYGYDDLPHAAAAIAQGAFEFAGQRCTANRRVIIAEQHYEQFLQCLDKAVADLVWGQPSCEKTQIGPLVSQQQRNRIAALVARSAKTAASILVPHCQDRDYSEIFPSGAYYPPTIVCCDNPAAEIVREESFGPILVVQKAENWDHALSLLNGVEHGLVSSLFSDSTAQQKDFLTKAEAGIIKINQATAGADAQSPFGGWKASGAGPPEHGPCNREFYTRIQTVYGV